MQSARQCLQFSAMSMAKRIVAAATFCLMVSCASHREATIQHEVQGEARPWTTQAPDFDPNRVRFAVYSDLTGGERDGVFEVAVEQLNLLRPELIVNVGDLIKGGNEAMELDRQWESFDARASRARAPVFYTGGNHDLLGEQMRTTWEERLGPRYYHFRYRDVLFLVLDTDDYSDKRLAEVAKMRDQAMEVAAEQGWDAYRETEYARLPENKTGAISAKQSAAMIKALRDHSDVRWTFVLMHKAPWTAENMPTWAAIEAALAERPYTVFNGHRHSYAHEQRKGRDYIRLATTGGVFLTSAGPSFDHVLWVTVDDEGAHIANLKMSGILDKTGKLPLNGEQLCLEFTDCPD